MKTIWVSKRCVAWVTMLDNSCSARFVSGWRFTFIRQQVSFVCCTRQKSNLSATLSGLTHTNGPNCLGHCSRHFQPLLKRVASGSPLLTAGLHASFERWPLVVCRSGQGVPLARTQQAVNVNPVNHKGSAHPTFIYVVTKIFHGCQMLRPLLTPQVFDICMCLYLMW